MSLDKLMIQPDYKVSSITEKSMAVARADRILVASCKLAAAYRPEAVAICSHPDGEDALVVELDLLGLVVFVLVEVEDQEVAVLQALEV